MKMQDLADHPFSAENIAYESGAFVHPSERAWLAFAAECERLLGHSLDGNDPWDARLAETGDGFSIDEAVGYFDGGSTPEHYVKLVKSRERYHGWVE